MACVPSLRPARQHDSSTSARCCGCNSLCGAVLRAQLSLRRAAARCCAVPELLELNMPNLPNSWLPRPALCVWAFAAHRKSLPLTGNWQHGLARVCLLHAAGRHLQMSSSNVIFKCHLRMSSSNVIFKCPPAEQINAQTHIGRGGQYGNYMTVRELGTVTYT